MEQINVNERITALERVNPTPHPTTYPSCLFWKDDGILSLDLEAQVLLLPDFLFERFLSTLASLKKMQVVIKDGNAMITAKLKVLNSCMFRASWSCLHQNLGLHVQLV
ncbi:hypothetical protein ACFXTH_022228 [Malus domestica]